MTDVRTEFMNTQQAYDYAKKRSMELVEDVDYHISNGNNITAERNANELAFFTYCMIAFAPDAPWNRKANDG